MTAQIIDGKKIAGELLQKLKEEISQRKIDGVRSPCLAVLLIGDNPASEVYVRNKKIACEKIGIKSISVDLRSDVSEEEVLTIVKKLNDDNTVDGILVQSPLPAHVDEKLVIEAISPNKDVDGFHPLNIGLLAIKRPKLRSCTPYGVIKMLKTLNVDLVGMNATVVGASNNVGRPMALELLLENCTVTMCNSKTKNLESKVNQADLLVVAAGIKNLVKGEWIKQDAIVIDIGINRVDGKLVGDVEFSVAKEKASFITPVPGGVGPMTVATLMENTLLAQKLS
ncbi:MAG: bifunctional 5,10-methylene-tetrahydrofolate dehydrogenase/5,10-methylene-tetrahydrofolate cyclohydrolase [Methylophilales bacterium BACL14 MAG-120910-bin43]|jgi:methylenetetrahydrofolate dehydrogenase (NADP+) / methenyltetrahydrofolate cyclohydrolase|nr:MAG: bifunctional 5,10-methylene-tetrahydrofolate dehydrogenase/5,10-methylene-tetrahydrofolate cyclohydrolase [Methylophilales bacterium BACL14 MAG-120910-bin43]KRP07029.1 MAG: bifunctional 5,10-methylene-tetrahydrofolate dehydrogenase/5,10-methylene-tetrahydrofolate cyclohydrolase [Methylophilales bacterium BACL14 MAG-120920-bin58]